MEAGATSKRTLSSRLRSGDQNHCQALRIVPRMTLDFCMLQRSLCVAESEEQTQKLTVHFISGPGQLGQSFPGVSPMTQHVLRVTVIQAGSTCLGKWEGQAFHRSPALLCFKPRPGED